MIVEALVVLVMLFFVLRSGRRDAESLRIVDDLQRQIRFEIAMRDKCHACPLKKEERKREARGHLCVLLIDDNVKLSNAVARVVYEAWRQKGFAHHTRVLDSE